MLNPLISLNPMDVVVVHGLWYMPHHWLINWRSLDDGAHCVVIKNSFGDLYNPTFAGIKVDGKYGSLKMYEGREVSILRYKHPMDIAKLIEWCETTTKESEGYDFFGQWVLGFVCGLFTSKLANNPKAWTCAEFPYWAFQDCGYKLTSRNEVLPMPRLFRYHSDFDLVYEGTL